MYQPARHLLWDVWFAHDGERHHAYYLQAPRPLAEPEARHDLAEVGHATSTDLVHWHEQPVAFRAGPAGTWDDRSIFTGSVLQLDGRAHLFYTSTCRREGGLVQRIGHAVSSDLQTFRRVGDGPILEADPLWYETTGGPYDEVHWRDPWAVVGAGRVHLFLTARTRGGTWDERGTIALATSEDMVTWTVHPPVVVPGDFWLLEVPQVLQRHGRWWMIAATNPRWHAASRLGRLGHDRARGGLVVYVADQICGPYTLARDAFLVGDHAGTHYTGKIIATATGDVLVVSRFLDDDGGFLGALADPVPVTWGPDGPRIAADALPATSPGDVRELPG